MIYVDWMNFKFCNTSNDASKDLSIGTSLVIHNIEQAQNKLLIYVLTYLCIGIKLCDKFFMYTIYNIINNKYFAISKF